jgi:glycosyltransferase involved in cell wall biosynthesis
MKIDSPKIDQELRVSVIIPVYNGRQTIQETLQSVLTQNYKKYEIIIVDDGSTDDTVDFIQTHFPGIRVIQQKNQGTMAARQNGINSSSGELIAFLDQDDIWFSDHLAIAVNFLNNHPEYGLFVANMEAIDENGNKLNFNVVPNPENYSLTFDSLLLIQPIATSTTVFQRKVVEEIGGLNTKYGFSGAIGDLDLFVRVAEVTKLYFENNNLGKYRWSEARPGRLISFANNLKIYAKTFWQHPRISKEDGLELRGKFVKACYDYGIVIWRLLLKQFDNQISLEMLEQLNEHHTYMQNLFAGRYEKLTDLSSVNIKAFQVERESVRALLFLYLLRKDLQEYYPNVLRGELNNLLSWASDVAYKKQEDMDYPTLNRYAAELLYLERDALRVERDALANELSRLKDEVSGIYRSRSWRITAPIRKLTDAVRYLRQQVRHLLPLRTLPKRMVLKLVRAIFLWIVARQNVYRIAIAMVNRIPKIKNRLKLYMYGYQQMMPGISIDEQFTSLPISPPVRKIYTDLVIAIKNNRETKSTN